MQPEKQIQPIENIQPPTPVSEPPVVPLLPQEPVLPPAPLVLANMPVPVSAPTTTPIEVVKKAPRQRHFLAAFFISFMWGTFGVDRMYMGYWGLGFLKLITIGGFGVWVIVDLILIMGGNMRDKQGGEMLQIAEYKKFASRTVFIFAIVLGLVVLLNGIALIIGVYQFFTTMQNGGGLPGGLDGLLGGMNGMTGAPPDLMQEFNQ